MRRSQQSKQRELSDRELDQLLDQLLEQADVAEFTGTPPVVVVPQKKDDKP
jgi:hypothetical protein